MWTQTIPTTPGWYFSTFEGWGSEYEVLEAFEDGDCGIRFWLDAEIIEPGDLNPHRWYIRIPDIAPPVF